ncbi:hypothetical protein [Mycobacterium sp.]|uniref:hypothetical protein n=1 Tax=Mycobacterium sp. TaxID=1785 RepID=UPI002DA73751|nr:hypothetical protein [Mycobacterium sp.]
MDEEAVDDEAVDEDAVDEDGSSPSALVFASVSVAAGALAVSEVGATSAGEAGGAVALVVAGAAGPAGAELAAFCSDDVAGAGSVVEGSATRCAGASAVVSGDFTTDVGDAGATGVMTGAVVGATGCGAGSGS